MANGGFSRLANSIHTSCRAFRMGGCCGFYRISRLVIPTVFMTERGVAQTVYGFSVAVAHVWSICPGFVSIISAIFVSKSEVLICITGITGGIITRDIISKGILTGDIITSATELEGLRV